MKVLGSHGSWWLSFNPFEKYMLVKLDHETPGNSGWKENMFETTSYFFTHEISSISSSLVIDIQIESIYTAIIKSMSSMFEMHGKLLSSDLSFLEILGYPWVVLLSRTPGSMGLLCLFSWVHVKPKDSGAFLYTVSISIPWILWKYWLWATTLQTGIPHILTVLALIHICHWPLSENCANV